VEGAKCKNRIETGQKQGGNKVETRQKQGKKMLKIIATKLFSFSA